MIGEIVVRAYAKVNFGLKVFPKNGIFSDFPKIEDKNHNFDCYLQYAGTHSDDEYHYIESIFQTVDLYDELTVSWDFETVGFCKVSCVDMELPEKNTINMAYHAFCQIVKDIKIPSVLVKLKKGIPSGGGLGGGSSDAAALVRVLEQICGVKLSFEQLDLIASKVGSDVFFFMHCNPDGKGCALVSGRGEIIENIKPRRDLFLLLIFPEISSSTKIAYSLIDKHYEEEKEVTGPALSELEAIYNGPVAGWTFINTFTCVIAEQYELIKNSLIQFKNAGCSFADMSGSGSTVYGVFTDFEHVKTVGSLLGKSWNCKLVRTV